MSYNEQLKANAAKVKFDSSSTVLNNGFEWAKRQAMQYVHFGEDPVGLWYEAALPGRDSFCIRDICHQSMGANILGLREHTKNMLLKFMINMDSSRDYCTFWEITREGKPTPVDYTNDGDFWYNLPANFDLIRSCYLQYLWTGDKTYISDERFDNFYSKTVYEYTDTWDRDKDGIPEHYAGYGRRGIASYNEADLNYLMGGDMPAIQYAGLVSYSEILKSQERYEEAEKFIRRAEQVRNIYLTKWWDDQNKRFYGAMKQDGTFYKNIYNEANFLPLFYGIVPTDEKLDISLRSAAALIDRSLNVEGMSYVPEIYYRYGMKNEAWKVLMELIHPELPRREYPEVSFAVVSTYVMGLMGINAERRNTVSTVSNLGSGVEWAEIRDMPILNNEIAVRHTGDEATEFENRTGRSLIWKVAFPGKREYLKHNGRKTATQSDIGLDGKPISFLTLEIEPGKKQVVSV